MTAELKRFYSIVTIEPASTPDRFRVLLDGKPVKTPQKRAFDVRGARLADAVAQEWRAQEEKIRLAAMPMTRCAMSVCDHVAPRMAEVRAEALAFAETDLLCYRAGGESEALSTAGAQLAARQSEVWQPFLDWAANDLGARLAVGFGVLPVKQPREAVAALSRVLGDLDAERLFALHALTHRFGSLVLALGVVKGRTGAAEAFAASRLDEIFQAEKWGRDEEAEARVRLLDEEVANFGRFLSLLP